MRTDIFELDVARDVIETNVVTVAKSDMVRLAREYAIDAGYSDALLTELDTYEDRVEIQFYSYSKYKSIAVVLLISNLSLYKITTF